MRNSLFASGFTLVELIVVIIVSSILAVGTSMFIMQAVRGYVDVAGRDDLATSGRIAIERMTREIRDALPNCVVVPKDDDGCIVFFPIVDGGLYASEMISHSSASTLPTNSTTPYSFHAYGLTRHDSIDVNNTYVAIYPVQAEKCYDINVSDSHLRILNSIIINSSDIFTVEIVNSNSPFPDISYGVPPQNRFFLVENPISFFISENELRMYRWNTISNYESCRPSNESDAYILARNVHSGNFFYTDMQALTRNGMVRINLALQRPDEPSEVIRFSHEVQIRNAP